MSLPRLALKTLLLFIAFNLLFALWLPLDAFDGLSIYNRLVPGRARFPFGENPQRAYNLSLYSVDAMFASHVVSAAPQPDEYRVFLLGDSSVWGTLLTPEETLAGQLNSMDLACRGKPARFYNLGYPTISLTKDLMLLQQAARYQPDRVIWLFTLESFPFQKQLDSPIAANNPQRIRALIDQYNLTLDPNDPAFAEPAFIDRTIVGQRRALADLFRLQIYGVLWAATGIDQEYPVNFPPAQRDFETVELEYHGWQPPALDPDNLAFEVFPAAAAALNGVPLLLVNEPMLVSTGQGRDQRYNFFYPRWVYDAYRAEMLARAAQLPAGVSYLDFWDLVPESEFTNSAIHLTPTGENLLARSLVEAFCE